MRRAAAIACVVVCAGCTSHGGRAPVSASSASPRHATVGSSTQRPSTHRATATRTAPSARSSAPDPAAADDPAVVPAIAEDSSTLGLQLVAAEQAVRAPGTGRSRLLAAARTAQVAYRRLALHRDWDATVLPSVPASLRATVVANLRTQRELRAIINPAPKDLLPPWRIEAPAPAGELLAWYHAAGAQFGVGWQYLAAVNLAETTFGKIRGLSASGAQGPMQFLPETWTRYGNGGDVTDPHDAIFAAARYLADRGFARGDVDGALYAYNPTVHYVNAIKAIASVLVTDPGSFAGYYRWDVYYPTSSGVLLLPRGFSEDHRTSAAAYARAHPERVLH
jgi:membrane-bound lytic murein transglycosylase B